MFANGQRLFAHRWPAESYARISEVLDQGDDSFVTLAAPPEAPEHWSHLTNGTSVRISGYFGAGYPFESVPCTVIGESTIRVAKKWFGYGIETGGRAFIENVPASENQSGFFVHQNSKTVYVTADSGSLIELPTTEGFLHAEGIKNLTVKNLKLFGYTGDALVLRNVEDSNLNELSISGTGGRAIVIDGRRISIRNGQLDDLGEGGIFVKGGSRIDLSRGDNSISQTRIAHYDVLARSYRPAVEIVGVGNSVIDSTLSDGNHSAIIFSGNDHKIANNRIARVTQEMRDMGAIYAGRDWTSYGTVIENNIFEDIHNVLPSPLYLHDPGRANKGIYLDDGISGITIRENVFVNTPWAVFLNGGKDNLVERNIFISSSPPVWASAFLVYHSSEYLKPTRWSQVILSELAESNSRLLERLPALWRDRFSPEILKPTGNVIANNIFVNSGDVAYDAPENQQYYAVYGNIGLQFDHSQLATVTPSEPRPEFVFESMWRKFCEKDNFCSARRP